MAVAGLLLRPPPCVATCTPPSPSPSSKRRLTRAKEEVVELDVSREFKSTLEREIGLDEVPPSTNDRPTTMNNSQQPAIDPSSDDKPEAAPYTSEELMKVTEEQLSASAAAAWNTQEPPPSQHKEAAATSESNGGALSRGSDGAGAAMSEPNPSNSEKTETER
ncbi:hypothetical protein E2562_011649 [Oryza meyeriana var. granulata]|uniref:Uncharacterized protein n=1 Tax=Oryza meyeriana var. granulata TaxID=110450 RepID=A0A6G1DIV1_9ORYZ|nr:hypothetical protein E2562_011649 [Oryza meyeriana var. granulata]